MEEKYNILWFESEEYVSQTSTESVCINDDEEEENSDIEYESDSDRYSACEECFCLAKKTQATLRAFVSHNIMYESYKTSMTMYNILHFYVLTSRECSTDNHLSTIFKVWSMLHHGSVG